MNKSLLGVALLAATGAVSAQSSVTLFGVVDTNLAIGRGTVADRNQISNSGNATSRIGFRGVEDLGGGMSASFWLEAGLATDDGQGNATNSNNQTTGTGAAVAGRQGVSFNRRATVSLAGAWGEVRLGRDYTPQYWNLYFADPFGNVGVGLPMPATYDFGGFTGSTAVRSSNGITYFLPGNIGGFSGSLQYYLGESPQNGGATEDDGTGAGVRVGYESGPVYASLATGRTQYAAGNTRQTNAVATYNFGVAKVGLQVSRDKNGPLTGKGWLLGAWLPVGAGEILGSYSQYETSAAGNPEGKKLALGYVHNLSKRTALYTTWARVKNSGGAATALNGATTAPNSSSSGLDIGIRHRF
ncbi:MAG: porin [Ramlibacter sp.]|nr:porin [Ramlibacter sp.]